MTFLLVILGLILIVKFWRSILGLGIFLGIGTVLLLAISFLNVWIGMDINMLIKALFIIVIVLIVLFVLFSNTLDKIFSIFK